MRRPSTVELMLLATVLVWALNLNVTKYILTHSFLPRPYAKPAVRRASRGNAGPGRLSSRGPSAGD